MSQEAYFHKHPIGFCHKSAAEHQQWDRSLLVLLPISISKSLIYRIIKSFILHRNLRFSTCCLISFLTTCEMLSLESYCCTITQNKLTNLENVTKKFQFIINIQCFSADQGKTAYYYSFVYSLAGCYPIV